VNWSLEGDLEDVEEFLLSWATLPSNSAMRSSFAATVPLNSAINASCASIYPLRQTPDLVLDALLPAQNIGPKRTELYRNPRPSVPSPLVTPATKALKVPLGTVGKGYVRDTTTPNL
jgi:hypothetical protein